MATFREYSARLASMSSIRRVTATMKMVAASHLLRAQTELHHPEPFAEVLRGLLPVMRNLHVARHRVCAAPPAQGSRILLVVITSHRGFCGAFNSSVIREARQWAHEQAGKRGAQLEALYAGQKGHAALKAELAPCMTPPTLSAHPSSQETVALTNFTMDAFMAGRYDEVWVAGNRFVSTLVQETTIKRLLPLEKDRVFQAGKPQKMILEPADGRLITALARQWLHLELYTCLLHGAAGEQAARVMAMENATINLSRMEKELTLLRNRARQAAITNELTEIVSGAESLG
ncbi:MAG: ATP synthase F1 subunit gamma [Kiritimatiellia bacterium]|jgi:F-type H+-transporting ATPase subunit gamma